MLVLGTAACILAQHSAMPPRDPCPGGLAFTAASMSTN